MRKGPAIALVSLLLFAFVAGVFYFNKPASDSYVNPYHLTNVEAETVNDYATEQDLVDHIVFPAEFGTSITWRATKDGWSGQVCTGTTNGSGGLWTSDCCGDDECQRTNQPNPDSCKAYVARKIP